MSESLFTKLMNMKPGNFPEQVISCPFLDNAAMVGLIPIGSCIHTHIHKTHAYIHTYIHKCMLTDRQTKRESERERNKET
jgi:hypothetical protein